MKKHPPGTLINNRYKIIKPIGEGAFATVYMVDDILNPGVRRAIKEHTKEAIPKGKEELLHRETRFLASLSNPGLPKYVDHFFFNDNYYIVMEYLEGDTLDSLLIFMDEPFSEKDILPWVYQLCDILDYLHNLNPPVIYRDLKPSNLIITPENDLKLIDFGTARFFNPVKLKDTFIMGTPGFAPPEQYGSEQSDARSDIYALGATFYFLLTRCNMESAKFIFPPVRQSNPKVSEELEQILKKCMDIDPKNRYKNIAELKEALIEKFGKSPRSPTVKEKPQERKSEDGGKAQPQDNRWLLSLFIPSLLSFILLLALSPPPGMLRIILLIIMFGSLLANLVISGSIWKKSHDQDNRIPVMAFWISLILCAVFGIFYLIIQSATQ